MAQAVKTPPSASYLPDDMVAGGLADDFDGTIRMARMVDNFDYNGTIDHPVFALMLRIERHDVDKDAPESEKFIVQHWSAGDLKNWRPGMTGDDPDETSSPEGFFSKPVGKQAAMQNTTNMAQLMRSIVDAQFPRAKFDRDIRFLEGVKAHWNRLPKDKKSGQFKNDTPEQQAARAAKGGKDDVLCVTRFDGFDGATAGTAPKAAATATASAPSSTPAPAAGSNGAETLDSKLAAIVVGIVKPGAPATKKTALAGAVLKAMKGDKDQNKGVKRVAETDFLEGLTDFNIVFDAEAGTVEALEV